MHAAVPSFGLPSPECCIVYNKWSACCLHPDWVPYLLGQVVACSACQSVVFLLLGRQGHLVTGYLGAGYPLGVGGSY